MNLENARITTKNARVHFFARRVHFAPYFHEADFLKIACRAIFTNENGNYSAPL